MTPLRARLRRDRRPIVPRGVLAGALLALALGCTQERASEHEIARHVEKTAMTAPPPAPPAGALPIEEVAKYPLPGTSIPGSIRFSADGKWLTYLASPDRSLTRQLYVQPVDGSAPPAVMFTPPEGGATEENLSPEEKLQRERRRERALGVTRYAWAREGERVMVPLRGDLWVQDGTTGTPRKVVDTEGTPALDPLMSRDGTHIAWVQDDELYTVEVDGGEPRQLTSGARGTGKTHGLAEYIAQEEMSRHRGFWWSHDGEALAYTEVDETHIPIYRINHQGRADRHSHEDHGYPFAGEANAKVRLGVVPRAGGDTVWMDLGLDGEDVGDDLYLARVHWLPDGSLAAQIENREQTRLDLVRFDPRTGARTLLLTERTDVWINLHSMFRTLDEGEHAGHFLWASERTGFMHLYLYDGKGTLVRALTEGEWMVDSVVGVDDEGGTVYFMGTRDDARERHLYRVPLAGGEIERLTPEPGMHGVAMARSFTHFVDTHQSPDSPPKITLRKTDDGSVVREIPVDPDPRVEQLNLPPPELVELKSRDGTKLYGAIYRPPRSSGGPLPTLVSVYGGPHAQRVTRSWGMTVDLRAQYLASLGFLVFKLDNRGAARRGLKFEGAIKHDMGNLEVSDQVDGVRWLVQQGLTDPHRVGIYGWSYGGYMSAMALARAPETFKAAVAGAPVAEWEGYDTHYTERYMGTPKSNPEGYQSSSVLTHVDDIEGALLVVHGLIDENVHFRHAARMINALVRARKQHELMLFPDERHMPRAEADRVYMEERVRDFFVEQLGPLPPV